MSTSGIKLGGAASGMDTAAIIEAMLAPEQDKITKIEKDMELNTAKIDTWKDIAIQLQDFGNVLSVLKSSLSTSVYNKKAVSTTDKAVLTAVATNAAQNASYPINVTQLAQSQVIGIGTGNNWAADSTLSQAVEFHINDSSEISLAKDATLDQIVTAINSAIFADSSDKVTASKIKVSSPGDSDAFTLVLQAGSSKDAINIYSDSENTAPVSGTAVFDVFTGSNTSEATISETGKNLPFFINSDSAWGGQNNLIREKQNASITLFSDGEDDGIALTSYTNQFSDALPGLNISVNTTGTSTIEVKADTAQIKEAITEFVSSYNDIKGLLDRVRDVKLDKNDKFGPFFSDALLRRVSSQVRSLATGVIRMGSEANWASATNVTVKSSTATTITVQGLSSNGETLASGDQITINSIPYTLTESVTITGGEATFTTSPAPTTSSISEGTGVFLLTKTLENIGIGVQTEGVSALDGKLAILDEGALDAALSSQLDLVQDIFRQKGEVSSDTGVAQRMYDWVNQQTFLSYAVSSNGSSLINKRAIDDVKLSSLEISNANLEKQVTTIESRIAQRKSLLEKQFSQMESAMSKSQSMTGALSSLNSGSSGG